MTMIERLHFKDKEILIIDYRGCKESQMIERASEAQKLILSENKPCLLLSVFNDTTYITPKFTRHAEKITREALDLIVKSAFLGLSTTKKLLLKGHNYYLKRNFKAFDTKEDAIRYLLDETNTDNDLPAYLKNVHWP